MAGVVKVHQLAHAHTVLREGEVVGNVDVVEDFFPEKQKKLQHQTTSRFNPLFKHSEVQI